VKAWIPNVAGRLDQALIDQDLLQSQSAALAGVTEPYRELGARSNRCVAARITTFCREIASLVVSTRDDRAETRRVDPAAPARLSVTFRSDAPQGPTITPVASGP
jgi:hypothetical protein